MTHLLTGRAKESISLAMADPDDEDAAFSELAAQWDRRLAEAGDDLDAATPSPKVWERISARVDHLQAAHGTMTVPADSGVWDFVAPGVYRKQLHVSAGGDWRAMLIRVEPGGTIPPHRHGGLEECLVLEGEFELEGETVRKGDFHLAFPGRDHAPIFSRDGALLYIRSALPASAGPG
jgi:quercetin dioxygenase-like cupin family protein